MERHRHTGHGTDGDKISYNDLKDLPTGRVDVKTGSFFINASGDVSISGVGFQPKGYRIWATYSEAGGTFARTDGSTDGTTNVCDYIYNVTATSGQAGNIDNTKVIYMQHNNGSAVRLITAIHKSFDKDGFTITATHSGTGFVVNFVYAAWG